MNYNMFLIKYGEIGIKGKNRYQFEDKLVQQIKRALSKVGKFKTYKADGRIYTKAENDFDFDRAIDAIKSVFGIIGICPCVELPVIPIEELYEEVKSIWGEAFGKRNDTITFKVNARRSNKGYRQNSMQINASVGEAIIYTYDNAKVDVHNPEILFNIEVREKIFIYFEEIKGAGGMPVGTAKTGMLLLSGGIDSPVAGYLMAKRGMPIAATYFHAPPYTSERALQKVKDLAKIISKYTGPIQLNIVNFTDIQLYIYEKCPHDELTIIMRRYMMKLAEKIGEIYDSMALITGESVGQVASQTVESLYCTNEVCKSPVFRPLIAFDKQEIVEIAKKIGTFDTSILPYEDCCTIFVAKHPVTKPKLDRIVNSEKKLDKIDELCKIAIENMVVENIE